MGYADQEIRSTSKFLKIDAGQPHDIRLLDSEPIVMFKHPQEGVQAKVCEGSEDCPDCADGEVPLQKFITNVFDFSASRVLLWEYGTGVAKQIKSIAITLQEEGKNIMDIDLKVDATGSGPQKRYQITPRMSAKIVPQGLVKLKIQAPDGKLPF